MSKNLAITVLTWNDWQNTTKCLESIFQSSFENFDVILVDNNSDEVHLKKIREWANNKIKIEDEEFNFNPDKKIDIVNVTKELVLSEKGKKKIYLISSREKKNERYACTRKIKGR